MLSKYDQIYYYLAARYGHWVTIRKSCLRTVKCFLFVCNHNPYVLQAVGVAIENAITLYEDLIQWSILAWNAEKHSEG